jgi:hypothetical protein
MSAQFYVAGFMMELWTKTVNDWKEDGKILVFTNGKRDILPIAILPN